MALPKVADALGDYGQPTGGFNDYLVAITDPTTDWASGGNNTGAPGANQLIVDVAGMTHTIARAWARFLAGTSPTLQNVSGYDAVWGSASANKPVPAHVSTGVYTLTWPSTVTDTTLTMGQALPVNLRWSRPSVEGSALYDVQSLVTAPNIVTVYVYSYASFALGGTVSVTNNSASITFSTNQTLPAGTALMFTSQIGVLYYLASAIVAGTAGTLTGVYTGTTAGATSTNVQALPSDATGVTIFVDAG